ncbi:hypothetical protein [Streptomyces sp. 8L]|uniref:hypothetical protein n=1 Tax=unclassified Streptomyces TaxID=2593676 RepID=UPI001CD53003|nr:hypothetical protein [Streptomyces sp. 8L]MCA1221909.1 hypothetical protein [Streptomyces sp. 8L]
MTTEENKTGKGTRTGSANGTAARRTVQGAAGRAKEESAGSAQRAKDSATAAEKAAATGTTALGAAASHAGRSAAAGLDSGRKAAASLGTSVTSGATLAWTAVKDRKRIAAGAGAGFVGLMGAAFAAGRATAKSHTKGGPLTRLTSGRI